MAQRHTKEVPANPQAELHQHGALAQAIATAAMEAASDGEDAVYRTSPSRMNTTDLIRKTTQGRPRG
jgi:hypothetical protein